MTLAETLKELEKAGSPGIKKILMNHGAKEPLYGVKVGDLKIIHKSIKNNQQLAMELFETGNYDAMYLAGLVADGAKMTRNQLDGWAKKAYCSGISEYTVPWVTSESKEAMSLAEEWIDSKNESVAVTGWATLSSIVSVTQDDDLDIKKLKALMDRVAKDIHKAPNRVRYVMNGFVLASGGFVISLTDHALSIAGKIGDVEVDMNGTACKVPSVADYLKKMKLKGVIGKKKKTAKC
jgi:3-methyladenine DNA glycosylase AlkD